MPAVALIKVFREIRYAIFAGIIALIVFVFAMWLPNIKLLFFLVTDPMVPIEDKLTFPLRLLESIRTNFTLLSASYTIAIAILTGINVALIVYYIRRQKQQLSQAGMSVGILGIVSGVLGMGCAACGSLIITSFLGTALGASIIAILPFKGGEFGILGVILLVVATYLLAKQITKPMVCEITNSKQ